MYGMHSSWDDDSDGKKEKKKGIETERIDFEMIRDLYWRSRSSSRDLYIVSKMIEQKEVWGF